MRLIVNGVKGVWPDELAVRMIEQGKAVPDTEPEAAPVAEPAKEETEKEPAAKAEKPVKRGKQGK